MQPGSDQCSEAGFHCDLRDSRCVSRPSACPPGFLLSVKSVTPDANGTLWDKVSIEPRLRGAQQRVFQPNHRAPRRAAIRDICVGPR